MSILLNVLLPILYSCALSDTNALIAAVTASKSCSACVLLSNAAGVPVYCKDCFTTNSPLPISNTFPLLNAQADQNQLPAAKPALSVALIVNCQPVLFEYCVPVAI